MAAAARLGVRVASFARSVARKPAKVCVHEVGSQILLVKVIIKLITIIITIIIIIFILIIIILVVSVSIFILVIIIIVRVEDVLRLG